MSAPTPGDQVVVSVLVEVPPPEAFRIFTEQINAWWRGGLRYRMGKNHSVVHLESKLGGRLFESFDTSNGPRVLETGRITHFDPPARVTFEWRAANFKPDEKTEVDVTFEPSKSGTLVTVRHRGWGEIRTDHPARHGQDVPAFMRSMGMWWSDLMASLRDTEWHHDK